MGGFRRKIGWFSPRAVKEPTSLVVEEQIGTNSFRYKAVKSESNRLETKPMNMGLSYEDYRKNKETKKEKREKRRNHNANLWAEDAYGDEVSYGKSEFRSSKYTWEPTRWANWSYGSFLSSATDDNLDMFVKEPENYLTPTIEQIKAKSSYWTDRDIKQIKELSRVCYLKMRDDPDYLHADYEDENNCSISVQEHRKKKAIFDNVYTTFIPGISPLEQAIAINHKLNDIESYNNRKKDANGYGGSSFEFKRSDYSDPYINHQILLKDYNKKYKLDILNQISLMRELGNEFKVEKSVGEREVAYSDVHKHTIMKSYDQIATIEMYQRMLRGYNIKFATKNLIVNTPVETSEHKQVIIILLDFSGSMNEPSKQTRVNSILIDRFKYVMRGEAEVYFSYFVSSVNTLDFRYIKNEKDVKDFWKWFSNFPNGSATDIGYMVKYVADEIKKGRLHNLPVDLSKECPEILIINDGEDRVGIQEFPYKVNAISLMRLSTELKDLCINSGGKQIYIKSNNRIEAYSSKGMEVLAR